MPPERQQKTWGTICARIMTAFADIALCTELDVSAILSHILSALQIQAGALIIQRQGKNQTEIRKLSPEGQALVSKLQDRLDTDHHPTETDQWTVRPILGSRILLSLGLRNETRIFGWLVFQTLAKHPAISHQTEMVSWARALGGWIDLRQNLSIAQKRVQQMDVLNEGVRSLSSTLELQDLLQDIMSVACQVMESEVSTLMLQDVGTDELVFEITHGSTNQELKRYRMPKDKGIAGWVFTQNEPLIVNDPDGDVRFYRSVDQESGFHTRSILCVPMEIKGQPIGVLEVLNKKTARGFDANDVRMLYALAGQAAIAIENARLYQSLREERDRIIQAQEDVRRELARNLHDGTVQLLAAIAMNIEHVKRLLLYAPDELPAELDAMSNLARTATRQARTLLFELRPIILETRGLVPALQSYVDRLNEAKSGPIVELHVGDNLLRLRPHTEKTVFAIVQEAVNNSRKHSHAERIIITLTRMDSTLRIEVRDNGKGFELAAVEDEYETHDSLGLINMKERAGLIDGWLRIDTAVGKGTCVILQVPIPVS